MPHNRGFKTPTSTTRPLPKDPRLCIVEGLSAGLTLSKIRSNLSMKASTFQPYVTELKKTGIIRKVGYGVWELLELPKSTEKRTAGSSHVGTPQDPPHPRFSRGSPAVLSQSDLTRFQQDAVRTHAITTTWQVPRALRNWNNKKRTQYLTRHNIPHIQLGIGGGGQRIIVAEKKIWLLNKSLIVYDSSSYFAEDALTGKNYAIAKHLSIIKHIERLLHVSFEIGSDYKFRVSRQHHALIHNALAMQYTEAGEKLEVRTGKGLWLLIDNSYNMHETEGVHSQTAMTDTQKVQGFFNGLKDMPAAQGAPTYTPASVLEMISGVAANQAVFAENMTSHIEAVRNLSSGVKDMTAAISKLKEQSQ